MIVNFMMQNQEKNQYIFYPLLASEELTGGITTELEMQSVWEEFKYLPEEKKVVLTSQEIGIKMKQLQERFTLTNSSVEAVSVLLRWYYFGSINEIELRESLHETISEYADEVFAFLQKEVFTLKPKSEEGSQIVADPQKFKVRLPLLKALAEYPRLNEQLITAEKIRLKTQPDLVRPNLANWIRYYRDELGIGFHDQVTRGKFLFQSENGKKLSGDERERINLILKSLEEEFPVDINTEQATIVFPVRTQPSPVSSAFSMQQGGATFARTMPSTVGVSPAALVPRTQSVPTRPEASSATPTKPSFLSSKFGPAKNVAGETLHFSTGHVLPSEKESGTLPHPDGTPQSVAANAATLSMSGMQRAGINQNRGAALPRSPYSIRPLRMRDDANFETESR